MMSVKPAPNISSFNFVNVLRCHLKFIGNFRNANAFFQSGFNFENFFWFVFVIPVGSSLRRICSVPRYAITSILQLRSLIQMIWVYAQGVVASVICLFSWSYVSAKLEHECKPMDRPRSTFNLNRTSSAASYCAGPCNTIFHDLPFSVNRQCGQTGVAS